MGGSRAGRRAAAAEARESDDESTETSALLGAGAEVGRTSAAATTNLAAGRFVGAMTLTVALGVLCVVSLIAPAREAILGNPERDRMLGAWARMTKRAAEEPPYNHLHYHPDTASPLPRLERFKREYMTPHHDRVHHQKSYAPLNEASESSQRRRNQAAAADVLDISNTEPLRILVDTGAFYRANEPNAADSNPDAVPYSQCFAVGDWFQWGYASGSSPPCATPTYNGAPVAGTQTTHSQWVSSNQLACGGAVPLFNPPLHADQAPAPVLLCDRTISAQGQNCWGVCVKEDVLLTDDVVPGDPDYISECGEMEGGQLKYPGLCNMRQWMINQVHEVISEANSYLRARQKTAPLTLANDVGVYNAVYQSYGIPAVAQCARDARVLYRVPVKDSYCAPGLTNGLQDSNGNWGDVVFYPTMAQYAPNVGGWGGDAGKDQFGRPIVLVMGWTAPQTPQARLNYQRAGQSRSIILHEVVHGLGFSIYNFQTRTDSSGQISSMVELRPVPDDTADVWFVTSSRTLQVARDYFGCPTLTGLPLMGENQLGSGSRGSHWETRIMNEEFMAYGEGAKVSGMTIAMLEDLGFYLGNYSSAQCMYWGKNQGCQFVQTRCGTRSTTDSSITLSAGQSCNKPYVYPGGLANGLLQTTGGCFSWGANPILTQYCAPPNCDRQWPNMQPAQVQNVAGQTTSKPDWACSSSTATNFECPAGQTCTCSAECQRAEAEAPRSAGNLVGTDTGSGLGCSPDLGPVPAAGRVGLLGLLGDNPLADYPIIFGLGAAAAVVFFVSSVCSCIKGAHFRTLVLTSILINVIFTIAGVALASATIYAYFYFEELDGVVSQDAWLMCMGLALGTLSFAVYGISVVCCVNVEKGCCAHCKLGLFLFLLLLFCIICAQTLGSIIAFIWIYDSYGLTGGDGGAYSTLGQLSQDSGMTTRTGIAGIDDQLDEAMSQIESYMCNAYKKCCYTIGQADYLVDSGVVEQHELVHTPANCTGTPTPGANIYAQQNDTCVFQCVLPTCSQPGTLQEHCPVGCNYTAAVNEQDFTCVAGHSGQTVGATANILRDPSHQDFCPLLTGNTGREFVIPGAACHAMDKVGIVNITMCQDHYCDSGLGGFENFMTETFQWVREQIVPISILCGSLGLLESCQFCVSMGILCTSSSTIKGEIQSIRNDMRHPIHHKQQHRARDPGYNRAAKKGLSMDL